MIEAQKPDHTNLDTIIHRLREGIFAIPDFQRDFEWNPWDIRELMRSIFLDYYIGSLLLWKGREENFSALSCEPIYGYSEISRPEYIVLDGQQRLTALYYAFLAPDVPLPKRVNRAFYYLDVERFANEEYDQAFHYDWNSKWFNNLLSNTDAQYSSHIFPLSVVGSKTDRWELPNWVQGYESYWQKIADEEEQAGDIQKASRARLHAQNAKSFGEHLRKITGQYQISYIELDKDLAIDKICDIFTQINSRGVRLDIFDLVNALLKPKGLQLKLMWRKAAARLEFPASDRMNVYILQVMSIVKQSYCSSKYLYYLLPGQEKSVRGPDGSLNKEVLVADNAEFTKLWDESVASLESALNLLRHPQEFGVISARFLPYVSILPVFSALQASAKQLPVQLQLSAQRKIRRWYWASVFMNRYSGAVESTSARDYIDVKRWITNNQSTPTLIDDVQTRLENLDLEHQTRSGTSIYNGIFNLFVIKGARDWVTGKIPQYDDLDDHHIVPVSWVSELSKPLEISIHTILNRSPLTGDTNRNIINDKLPNEYLPKWIATNGEETVFETLENHFVSPKAVKILLRQPFRPEDYFDFITERKKSLIEAIKNLFNE